MKIDIKKEARKYILRKQKKLIPRWWLNDDILYSMFSGFAEEMLKKRSKDFHEWMEKENWVKHSSGDFYYRNLKEFSDWPPDETSTIDKLYEQFNEL